MKTGSNRAFVALWLVVVATAVALGVLMLGIFNLGIDARVATVANRVDKATTLLQKRAQLYARSFDQPPDLADSQRRHELDLILQLVLQDFEDVEGGFYATDGGFLAYGFPSYEGSGVKQDVPAAESARIAKLSRDVIAADATRTSRVDGERQVLILEGAPLRIGATTVAVWTMSRAHVRAGDASQWLVVGLGVLGLFVIGSGLGFAWVLRRWNRGLGALGDQLAKAPADQPMRLETTGHPDLDHVAAMVSSLHGRLRAEREASSLLEAELARARRVASLGRMTAQLVHEVRNPIAAMRLRAENALAGAGDRDAALNHVLRDIRRLDHLLERMQATTRLNALHVEDVAVRPWLERGLVPARERATVNGVVIIGHVSVDHWRFDPVQMARALDNLVLNAIVHARRPDGRVEVGIAAVHEVALRIDVRDNGAGIPPRTLDQVFDPFFTTRTEGTGLGLPIAREIVEGHEGTLTVLANDPPDPALPGAHFRIEIPWRAS